MKNPFGNREHAQPFGAESDAPPSALEERKALDGDWVSLEWENKWGESGWKAKSNRSSPEFIHWVHTALNKVLGTRLIADGPFRLEDPYECALRV